MNRRTLLKKTGLLAGGLASGVPVYAGKKNKNRSKNVALRVAHLTDIHIRPDLNAPQRFRDILQEVLSYDIDLVLNGGDSVYAVDYGDITRQRVNELWEVWHQGISPLKNYDILSCLGNHDMWWASPSKTDEMYGKDWAVKQLGISNRYYSIKEKNWRFVILDSNNSPTGSLDSEQLSWLVNELAAADPTEHILIMSHYPIFAAMCHWEGGMHSDYEKLLHLFYQHPNIKACLSGHIHLFESLTYNNVHYFCNGAVSGFWWEKGNEFSAGEGYYKETPQGFAILDLYEDGQVVNNYYPVLTP